MRLRPWLPRCRRALRRAAHACSCCGAAGGAGASPPLLQAAFAAALLTSALLLRAALPRAAPPAPAEAGVAAARAAAAECVAWRATRCGSGLAERVPMQDLPCYATIRPRGKHVSGACDACRTCSAERSHVNQPDGCNAGAGFCECAAQRVPSIAVARACGETALIWHLQRGAASFRE